MEFGIIEIVMCRSRRSVLRYEAQDARNFLRNACYFNAQEYVYSWKLSIFLFFLGEVKLPRDFKSSPKYAFTKVSKTIFYP
jgi:hypothetical protein